MLGRNQGNGSVRKVSGRAVPKIPRETVMMLVEEEVVERMEAALVEQVVVVLGMPFDTHSVVGVVVKVRLRQLSGVCDVVAK